MKVSELAIKLPVRVVPHGHLKGLVAADGEVIIRREDGAIIEQMALALNHHEALVERLKWEMCSGESTPEDGCTCGRFKCPSELSRELLATIERESQS